MAPTRGRRGMVPHDPSKPSPPTGRAAERSLARSWIWRPTAAERSRPSGWRTKRSRRQARVRGVHPGRVVSLGSVPVFDVLDCGVRTGEEQRLRRRCRPSRRGRAARPRVLGPRRSRSPRSRSPTWWALTTIRSPTRACMAGLLLGGRLHRRERGGIPRSPKAMPREVAAARADGDEHGVRRPGTGWRGR